MNIIRILFPFGLFYRYWQHEDTGYIVKLLFWQNPGHRYYKFKPTKEHIIELENDKRK